MLVAELADGPRVERIEMIDDLLAQAERRPDRDREAESMEERQNAEQHVIGLQVNVLFHLRMLLRILRCESTTPLGSAVEPEVKITVAVASRLSFFSPGTKPGKRPIGTSLATAAAQSLSASSNLLGDVFEQDELTLGSDLATIEHLRRGQNVGDLALFDRGIDHGLAGRVVEVNRNLAPERNRQVGDRGGHGRGNHQPEVGGRAPVPLEYAAQHECAEQRLSVSKAGAGTIAHGRAAGEGACLVNERPRKGSPALRQR